MGDVLNLSIPRRATASLSQQRPTKFMVVTSSCTRLTLAASRLVPSLPSLSRRTKMACHKHVILPLLMDLDKLEVRAKERARGRKAMAKVKRERAKRRPR